MSDTVQLIKEKLDLVEFLRPYLSLSPAGKNFKGLCPFHKEKTPSFIVSPDRQIWHCFGCSKGGDVIGFLMQYENLEFFEALKVLAEKAGVDVRVAGGLDQRQYAVLYDINQAAKEFFREYLKSDVAVAKVARDYLVERGLKTETIEEFELGLAPNSSDVLNKHLLQRGFKISDIERAGIVFKTERGTYWDRFRNRIMFPLVNPFGKPIGFTGRVMPGSEDAEVGKYVNSPETAIFNKSRLLFGFNKSKNAIHDAKTVVVVEGQMDLLMTWQDGVKNIVATSGTALTAEHLKNLKRLADTLVVAFDNDEAGRLASERVIDLAGAHDFFVKVINANIPNVKDPADLAKKQPGLLSKLVNEAEPAMQFYFRRYLEPLLKNKTPAGVRDVIGLKRGIRTVLSKIKAVSSSVEQAEWVRELGRLTSISDQHLFDEMNNLKAVQVAGSAEAINKNDTPENRNFSRRDLVSQRFLSLAVADPTLRDKCQAQLAFLSEPYQIILNSLKESLFLNLPPHLTALADLISLRSGLETAEPELMHKEFEELSKHLRLEYYRGEREIIGAKIREAEQNGDEQGLNQALRDFDRISKEMYNL